MTSEKLLVLESAHGPLANSLALLGFDTTTVTTLADAVAAVSGCAGVVVAPDLSAAGFDAVAAAYGGPRGVHRATEKHAMTGFRTYWLQGQPLSVLAFSGSARTGSLNRTLLALGVAALRERNVVVRELEGAEQLPLYNGDLEADGLPESVLAMGRIFFRHQGLLLATPEYNGFPTPLLKNTLDWVSRSTGGAPGSSAFNGTVAATVSAAGGSGGARVRPLVRTLLTNLRMNVVDAELGIAKAFSAFDADGSLRDPAHEAQLNVVADALVGELKERWTSVE